MIRRRTVGQCNWLGSSITTTAAATACTRGTAARGLYGTAWLSKRAAASSSSGATMGGDAMPHVGGGIGAGHAIPLAVAALERGAMFAPLAFLAVHPRMMLPSPWLAAQRLIPMSLRTAAGSGGGGGGQPPKKSGGDGGDGNGKDSNKPPGGASDVEDPQDDEMTARITFFVIGAFVASYVLYRWALPSGELTGWSTIASVANKITDVSIYTNYVQVYTDTKAYHLGVFDDEHTNEKFTKVHDNYQEGQTVNFQVLGTPLAEKVLYGFGLVAWVVPFIFFPSFVMILTRAMGTAVTAAGDGGRSKIKQMNFVVQYSSGTRFHDVAGMKEAKKEITEIVDFLKTPERFTRLGAKIPTGALLLGPPGTGKTLLAKAVAGEAGIGFIPVCGSDFVELYVGMGALRVRQLFELAKKQRCIVYIDEIDAIGMKRRGAGHGEKQEQEHTLNELLTQLDGFGSSRGQVMILASSNVPQDQLDPALIRPGRFDRLVHVDAPVIGERIEIFKVHLSQLKLVDDEEDAQAAATPPAKDVDSSTTSHDGGQTAPVTATTGAAIDPADDKARVVETPAQAGTVAGSDAALQVTTNTADAAAPAVARMEEPKQGAAPKAVTEDRLTVSKAYEASTVDSNKPPGDTFDIEHLLSSKTPTERRIIDNFAERMSSLCPGFVGADIANVCNEAAILAARESCTHVSISHLERSIDRVLAGIEHRSRVLSDFEKRVVAHHEAGHAIAGWFLNRADPLMKVSIVPRGGSALGYAQYLPNENKSRTANEIFDAICVTLGGRVAEKIFFDHLSTGASDDLQKVGRMAYAHVASFGGVTVYQPQGSEGTKYVKPYGAAAADRMDEAAKALVDRAYSTTMELLVSKKREMELLANHLLVKEVLTYQDVVDYLGVREERSEDRRRAV